MVPQQTGIRRVRLPPPPPFQCFKLYHLIPTKPGGNIGFFCALLLVVVSIGWSFLVPVWSQEIQAIQDRLGRKMVGLFRQFGYDLQWLDAEHP